MEKKVDVIVIGGGAAGMMAAGTAADRGLNVVLIEKNRMLGKKMLITGKGRCNITNACEDVEELLNNVTVNRSFLYSSFYGFTNQDTIEFFNDLGVETKVERGNRVFPVSDRSQSVVDAMTRFVKKSGVQIVRDNVCRVLSQDGKVLGVECDNAGIIYAQSVIVATGGASYKGTGSTGDGYKWAKELGHTVTPILPSLVPLEVEEKWAYELMGLALKNIEITVLNERNKRIYHDFGEMMFAHFGLSGPVILSASAHMRPMAEGKYKILLDLKPALDEKKLDARIVRDFSKFSNRDFVNSLGELLPNGIVDAVVMLSGIDPRKKVNSITKEERKRLVSVIKGVEFNVKDFCPIEQAIITTGGISVKEIDASTMQSKLVDGLYFAGEIIDVDGYTGGFNLQIAFSTGRLAGLSCQGL
ncbi:MAG: NAD(P)/FAD-dependent oxidoreductase [Clostridia bacterium]|nr:NAD(P)/FAD-dependent oxidoreductase [Clostridia bacterium]